MYTNKINAKQIKMVNDAQAGLIALPKDHQEFADALRNVLLAKDHEMAEREFLEKSKAAFIRNYFRLSRDLRNDFNFKGDPSRVYISQIYNVIKRRKYFETLKIMCLQRDAKALDEVVKSLIVARIARRDGSYIELNRDAAQHYLNNN